MTRSCLRTYETRARGFCISAVVQPLGPDFLVSIQGGQGHIGAVAVAESRPSLADPSRTSASSSVYCVLGHKEDGPAKAVSEQLAAGLRARVVVVAGIHWDNLSSTDLEAIQDALFNLAKTILDGELRHLPQEQPRA